MENKNLNNNKDDETIEDFLSLRKKAIESQENQNNEKTEKEFPFSSFTSSPKNPQNKEPVNQNTNQKSPSSLKEFLAQDDLIVDINIDPNKQTQNASPFNTQTNGFNKTNTNKSQPFQPFKSNNQNQFTKPTQRPVGSPQPNFQQPNNPQNIPMGEHLFNPNNTQPNINPNAHVPQQNQQANFGPIPPQQNMHTGPRPQGKFAPVLAIEGLTKVYGDRCAVNNIFLNVFPGQIVGFLGANGAGKSTTIKMLTGLAKATNGNAYICGKSVLTSFEQAIKNVGAMIEIPVFYPYLSGYNNLKYFAKISDIPSKQINGRINEVASLVGLANRIKDKVENYSLGMKQRLGIAQALLNRPKLLILDEPTNGLDANGIREVRLMLKTLAAKEHLSILISSHILGEMENLCDTIAIIDKGQIIKVQTLDEIKRSCMQAGSQFIKCNAPNLAGKIIMNKFNLKVKLQGDQVYFSVKDKTMLSQIIVNLTQSKILVFAAGDVDYSLEDVFLNIINKNNKSTSIN